MRLTLIFIAISLVPLPVPRALAADVVPGPFGVLQLPADYESHRSSFRSRISQDGQTPLIDVEGEGCIRHIWLTIGGVRNKPVNGLRLTLRIYTDGQDTPDVEMPVGPFFGIHHGHAARMIDSPYLQVTQRSGFNGYFPIPYRNGCRLTLQSDSEGGVAVWFQADYHRYEPGSLTEPMRFHALHRRVNPAEQYGQPYHLGHGRGRGVIVGVTIGMRVLHKMDSWYHCGGDQMLIDGGTTSGHVLSGIGGEDFFGTAWGQDVYSNRSVGTPYYDINNTPKEDQPHIVFAAYRFFDRDPIRFAESFWYDFGTLDNDVSSVLYWYQTGNAMPVSTLPTFNDRLAETEVPDGKYDVPVPSPFTWSVCGPFACEDLDQFKQSEFPEAGIDLTQTAPADFGQYAKAAQRDGGQPTITRWTTDVPTRFHFVDLTPWFRPRLKTNAGMPVDVSAYAATTIASEQDHTVRVRLGHDDPLRLWLNGELVYDGLQHNGMATTVIELPLRQGDNRILVKAANHDNTNFRAWLFLFDVLEE